MDKRNYELMFIVNPELNEVERESLLERVQGYLDRAEADVFSFKNWGFRRLAYTIKGQREGQYFLVQFAALPENISALERSLLLAEGILRQMVTVLVGEPAVEEPVVETEDAPEAEQATVEEAVEDADQPEEESTETEE